METYLLIDIIKKLQAKGISFFSLDDFSRLFKITNRQTLYKKIQRLEKKGVIKKLIRGRYQFLLTKSSDFTLANFIYPPSYLSLESALSFYGIITAFPYQITSVTVRKTKKIIVSDRDFLYSHFSTNLFWGYEKKENFLIAEREKALLDLIYLSIKGLRSFDIKELETSKIDKRKLLVYAKQMNNPKLLKVIQNI